jgi:predicted GNAT family N-acyltransferase
MSFAVHRVPVETIRPLRRAILRPTRPPEKSVYPQDDLPDTVHVAAYDDAGTVVGCVTVFPQEYGDEPKAWRLRGMATTEEMRGVGVGRQLLDAAIETIRSEGAPLLWCNARQNAEGFYERFGFVGVGDRFEIPVAGPHRVMVLDLRAP